MLFYSLQINPDSTISIPTLKSLQITEEAYRWAKTTINVTSGDTIRIINYDNTSLVFTVQYRNYIGYSSEQNIIDCIDKSGKIPDALNWFKTNINNRKLADSSLAVIIINKKLKKEKLAYEASENRAREIIRKQQEKRLLEELKEKQNKIQAIKRVAEHRRNLVEKYGESIANKIFDHQIWIGMSDEMAVESIGSPSRKNRTVTELVILEQWVYSNKYLYFKNRLLSSYQDSF